MVLFYPFIVFINCIFANYHKKNASKSVRLRIRRKERTL